MNRTTRAQVEGIFARFVAAIGGHVATSWDDVGGYRLDHNGTYGGYVVERVANASGGVERPFGDMRRGPSEMWDTLHFAIAAIHQCQTTTTPAPDALTDGPPHDPLCTCATCEQAAYLEHHDTRHEEYRTSLEDYRLPRA